VNEAIARDAASGGSSSNLDGRLRLSPATTVVSSGSMALSPPKNVMTPPVADIGDPDRRPGEMKTEAMLAARLAA